MAISALEKRKKQAVATKPAQLAGLGVIAPEEDKQGNKVKVQPTILRRPNALQMRAFQKGFIGNQIPQAGLADMATQADQAQANQTPSGASTAGLYSLTASRLKKKMKQGGA